MGDLIGLFGGTFDPPHIGHCILAEEAYHALQLDLVYWIPAGQPPHKPNWPISDIHIRLEMVESITCQNPTFECSRIDVDRPGPHYAKDTLFQLRELQPDAKFIYLMGSDSLRDLLTWKDPEIFVERTDEIGIMMRPGVDYDLSQIQEKIPGLDEKLRFFPTPLIEISGQTIRKRIQKGLPVRYMLTPEVHDIIVQHKLYQ